MQPFGDMEQLVKVERGLRDVESEIVREDDLLEATVRAVREADEGRSVGCSTGDGSSACVDFDGDGDAAGVSPAQAG